MFAAPILFAPSLLFAYRAWRHVYRSAIVSIKFSGDTEERALRSEENKQKNEEGVGGLIKRDMQSFLGQHGIRNDLNIWAFDQCLDTRAVGTNFAGGSVPSIVVDSKMYNIDKDACYSIMKHEISHLKNNDSFYIDLAGAVTSLAAAIFFLFKIMSITQVIPLAVTLIVGFASTNLIVIIGVVTSTIFSCYREAKADDFAIAHGSDDELKGFRRFFKACQQHCLKERVKSMWGRIEYSSTGSNRFDIMHPSHDSRIKKIEQALQQRGVVINDDDEEEKIEKLMQLFADEPKSDELAESNNAADPFLVPV